MDLIEQRSGTAHRHPWELSRAECLLRVLGRDGPCGPCLDVGAGDLYFTRRIAQTTSAPVTAVDAFFPDSMLADELPAAPGSAPIRKRRSLADVPDGGSDCAVAMDVLEHVEDDAAFVREIARKLRPGGRLLVTTPAWPFLFSAHDVHLKHRRRYRAGTLLPMLEQAGLEVREAFYFYALLFAVRCAQRLAVRSAPERQQGVGGWRRPADALLTRLIKGVLNLDFAVCRALAGVGLRLPGLSLGVLCVKKPA